MKVFVTGGTGFVGRTLCRALLGDGHEVTIVTRGGGTASEGAACVEGDPARAGVWQKEAARHDALINLAGAPIFRRWTWRAREAIRASRLDTTARLVEAISLREGKETRLLSASAVGYYGFRGDEPVDERGAAGSDFLSRLAADWEEAARGALRYGARVVLCRFGIVLGRDGGALRELLRLVRLRIASPLGSGRQWVSWIHEEDLARALLFLLRDGGIEGPVNCTAPGPVRNAEWVRAVAAAVGKRQCAPRVPSIALRFLLGGFADTMLEGQRVIPAALLGRGFAFRYPELPSAMGNLVSPTATGC